MRTRLVTGALTLLIPVLAATSMGCAGAQRRQTYVFPPPPDLARVQYVRSFRSSNDLDPGIGRRILNAILPHDPGSSIKTPTGIALSPDERFLYVTCGASGRIVRVDLQTKAFSSVGGSDPAKRPVVPYAVAVDGSGSIYVTDRTGGNVFVYDAGGAFVRKFGADRLQRPTDIAVDREAQQIYVASGATSGKGDHRIEVFSPKGDFIRTIGKRGNEEGAFNFPTGLTMGPGNLLYVADMLNFRVQSFDREGRFQGVFGQIGLGMPGAFDKIRGIAFDKRGNVFIVDARQGVHILNPARQPLLLFGGPPFMTVPGPIAIDSSDRIFVADFGQDSIHEFRLVNADAPPEPAPPAGGSSPGATPAAPPPPSPATPSPAP
jgi:DNA-binding beta-propeller fold protein YncE